MCLRKLRCNIGKKSVRITAIQIFMSGSADSVIYGPWTSNKKTKLWWKTLGRQRLRLWIQLKIRRWELILSYQWRQIFSRIYMSYQCKEWHQQVFFGHHCLTRCLTESLTWPVGGLVFEMEIVVQPLNLPSVKKRMYIPLLKKTDTRKL